MNSRPTPPIPAVADLDSRLRRTMDPAVSVAEKPLRIADDDKDPELITRISRVYAPVTTTVVQVTEVGPGQLLATAVLGSPEGRVPAIVPFVAPDGSWHIATGWACQTILATGESSPACPRAPTLICPFVGGTRRPVGRLRYGRCQQRERDTWWTRPTELPRATAAW
ncbi:hypothetical protein IU470_13785 [Nocardia abscessus]|uniref:Low molecular weight antigen MTB12-like C-terminal domain-containing protein n=1 Tax=Nocardia abscessus TaxID=120957 RepID=A0ABS0C719_9NOCA|nr:hypothetical protein [Nocardia abscessus]MBF6226164.1 hypothetical protein [Nocardia abscessus]